MISKKLFLTAILSCLLSIGGMAQSVLTVKGVIHNNGSVPIQVYIEIDHNTSNGQSSIVWSDSAGHYADSFAVVNSQGSIFVWIIDCNADTVTKSGGYHTGNLIVNLDLDYCANPAPHLCTAHFTKGQAYTNHNQIIPYLIHIVDKSTGSNLSYHWDFGDGDTSNLKSPTHTYAGNGPYILCLTVSNANCTSTHCDTISIDSNGHLKSGVGFTIVVGDLPSGIANTGLSQNSINIFPNPVLDFLNIENADEFELTEIKILTVQGKQVYYSQNMENSINVSDLEVGLYFLYLMDNRGEHYVQKFYKE